MQRSKSSLENHCFPLFYACYLLKSAKTPKSTATYIGSTPNPPRRIRQHNGEIAQGAWKTRNGRPWVMQMIVHGFPSRLAALQFEWAWQHPHLSRHLRTQDGKQLFSSTRRATVKANISVVRRMVTMHPYTLWPLQVTLFTPMAVKLWGDVCELMGSEHPLPPGFRESVVLEGVDGKAASSRDEWKKPIDATDAPFTTTHLAKHTKLLSQGSTHSCTICNKPINVAASDPLTLALCPTPKCTGVSHLMCISQDFLHSTPKSSSTSSFIPRGGVCRSCKEYTLWGDIIRASYRRRAGRVASEKDVDEDAEIEVVSHSDEQYSDVILDSPTSKSVTKSKHPSTLSAGKTDSECEFFNLDVSGSESDLETHTTPRASNPVVSITSEKRLRERPRGSPKVPATLLGNGSETQVKKRRGRPPKTTTSIDIGASPLIGPSFIFAESISTPKPKSTVPRRGTVAKPSAKTPVATTTALPPLLQARARQHKQDKPTLLDGSKDSDKFMSLFVSDTDEEVAPNSSTPLPLIVTTPIRRKRASPLQEPVFANLNSDRSSGSDSDLSSPSAFKLVRAMSTLSVSSPSRAPLKDHGKDIPSNSRSTKSSVNVINVSSDEDDVIVLSD